MPLYTRLFFFLSVFIRSGDFTWLGLDLAVMFGSVLETLANGKGSRFLVDLSLFAQGFGPGLVWMLQKMEL